LNSIKLSPIDRKIVINRQLLKPGDNYKEKSRKKELQNFLEKDEFNIDNNISNSTDVDSSNKERSNNKTLQKKEGPMSKNQLNDKEKLEKKLLDCDKVRCKLESYDKSILYDMNQGHWELFEDKDSDIAQKACSEYGMKERDPKLDIKSGVVGIDFGTTSTVVVRQSETTKIIPIRIGTGNLSSEIKESDYENPTIIRCEHLTDFLESYIEKIGRPNTKFDDFFVSHDAFNEFKNCDADEYYSFFRDLKQWANREGNNKENLNNEILIKVKDKLNEEFSLAKENVFEDKKINPLEIYAYYLGLYVNNMRNGIYLHYLLSFPVGYSREVRQFILDSFTKGIKKSLPSSICGNEDVINNFKVELGISEPAAYAVTALDLSDLDPENENEQYMYGIFDFGGGTTDFDFGLWRGASDDEYDSYGYDYVLECFGANSDDTLGGENMLELLAYHVFKENIDVVRENKILITSPVGAEEFLGGETIINNNSQIAMRNTSLLKEELRPLWEQREEWKKKYNDGKDNDSEKERIVLSLFNSENEQKPNLEFKINTDELIGVIKDRIQKGVDSFFTSLEEVFFNNEKVRKEGQKVDIFLAGNSSKSQFVWDIFEEKINNYYKEFKKLVKENKDEFSDVDEDDITDLFRLHKPLETKVIDGNEYIPNGKTGVAYGLVKSRAGSNIHVVKNQENDAEKQTRFGYYLGRERRKNFECKLSPAKNDYREWIEFQGASNSIIRIFYTTNPQADAGEKISIDNIGFKQIEIEPNENSKVFIRTVEPTTIEYVVASSIDDIDEKNCNRINFNDK
ncbi:MAG: hypothetical protein K6F77_08240, partial [Lachnospiraceae bacterium]|nr:hypothetical protein [Lachnospiraceae bacterium]